MATVKPIFALFTILCAYQRCMCLSSEERIARALDALKHVYIVQTSQCAEGTQETLNLQFNHSAWARLMDPAIRTANLLSKIMANNNNTLNELTDEMMYSMVRNNVHQSTLTYGSGLAIESDIYKYPTFCAYAYKDNGTVVAIDIAVNYDYTDPSTVWWWGVKNKTFDNITIMEDIVMYRMNNELLPQVTEVQPIASLHDGYWTEPYYDCGGGNIWMVTYVSPFFAYDRDTSTAQFKGAVGIDIELTHIDINQCDPDGTPGGAMDVFRGTHQCLPSTKCMPLHGYGFKRGTYKCICKDGFYFPSVHTEDKSFHGFEMEDYLFAKGEEGDAEFTKLYSCIRCEPGCDVCEDATPCLFTRNLIIRITILTLTVVTMLGICILCILTFHYRSKRVLKTASPVFLQIMCVGSLLMCVQMFIIFPEPTDITCSFSQWPLHLGFFTLYAALVLKTWRISVLFRVGSVKKINLPDQALLQRLAIIVVATACYMGGWTAASKPFVLTLKTNDGLKYKFCAYDWWLYAILVVEIVLLLYGVYLCYIVRKAPAHFNESKHIALATYNAIILGSFLFIITSFIGTTLGPDVMYVLDFIKLQAYVTLTLVLIFGPKFWALYKKIDASAEGADLQTGTYTITGRMLKAPPPFPASNAMKDVGIQTSQDLLIYRTLTVSASNNSIPGRSSRVAPMPT